MPWEVTRKQNSELFRGLIFPMILQFSELGLESKGSKIEVLGYGYSHYCEKELIGKEMSIL